MNLIPEAYRALAGVVAALIVIVGLYLLGRHDGAADVRADWNKEKLALTQAAIEADKRARDQELSMQHKLNEAQNAATEREKALRADYAAAHAAARGLRDTVAALRGQLATASPEACRATADAALAVFGECADRYRAVAEAADGHASDVETLTEAWPE
ncbi:MAG TPA: DUF2514 family protein [Azonexus sp.]|nr:DUF2514 family protein [Azonexus sp.]